jgi:hypothetical protein
LFESPTAELTRIDSYSDELDRLPPRSVSHNLVCTILLLSDLIRSAAVTSDAV